MASRSGQPTYRSYQFPERSSAYPPPTYDDRRTANRSYHGSARNGSTGGVELISSEQYDSQGRLISSSAARNPQAYSTKPVRRSTLTEADVAPSRHRYSLTGPPPTGLRSSAVVHNDPDRQASPPRSVPRGDGGYYVTSSASRSGGGEHRRQYSIDSADRASRASSAYDVDKERRRLVDLDRDRREHSSGASRHGRAYHLSGPAPRGSHFSENDGYEYTDARGMFRDTEPIRRRRGSVDTASRERPSSLVETYPAPRSKDYGGAPPPALRGIERMDRTRHESFSDDEGPRRRGDVYDRVPRHEDTDLASRGFGIRSPTFSPADEEAFHSRLYEEPPRQYSEFEPIRPQDMIRMRDPPRSFTADHSDSDRRRHDLERDQPMRDRDGPVPRFADDERRRDRHAGSDHDSDRDRRERDHDGKRGDDTHHSSHLGAAAAATAVGGAVAYGLKHSHDRKENERAREERPRVDTTNVEPKPRLAPEKLPKDEIRAYDDDDDEDRRPKMLTEGPRHEERLPKFQATVEDEEPVMAGVAERPSRPSRPRADSEEMAPRRPRNYVGREGPAPISEDSDMPRKNVDADEDFRRRMQTEVERTRAHDASRSASDEEDRRERDHRGERRRAGNGSDAGVPHRDESKALAIYDEDADHDKILDQPLVDEPAEVIENRDKRVLIVEPPKAKELPKGILKKPTQKFPEDPNPVREGVAPLKDAKKDGNIPDDARWTKIDRRLVNPQALEEAKERYEEREGSVIVLRVLTKEEIQTLADRTAEIRNMSSRGGNGGQDSDRHHRRRHRHRDDERDDKDGSGSGSGGAGGGGSFLESVIPVLVEQFTNKAGGGSNGGGGGGGGGSGGDDRGDRHHDDRHRRHRRDRDYDDSDYDDKRDRHGR